MYYIRYLVFAATLSIAGCYDELGSSPSTVETGAPPKLQLAIDTFLDSGTLQTSLQATLSDISGPNELPISLQLEAGDSLQATDGAQIIDLEPLEDDELIYAGTFSEEVATPDLVIALKRTVPPPNVDWWAPTNDSPEPDLNDFSIDAPNTVARLAQPFNIDMPDYNPNPPDPPDPNDGIDDDGMEEFTLDKNVTLVWTPNNSGEDMVLFFESTCGTSESPLAMIDIEKDPGTYTRKVDVYLAGQSEAARQRTGGCIIRLTLERETDDPDNLTPDPALSDSSTLVSRHRRFIEIKSVPPAP